MLPLPFTASKKEGLGNRTVTNVAPTARNATKNTSSTGTNSNSIISNNNLVVVGSGGEPTRQLNAMINNGNSSSQNLMQQLQFVASQLQRTNPSAPSSSASSVGLPLTPETPKPKTLESNNHHNDIHRNNASAGNINGNTQTVDNASDSPSNAKSELFLYLLHELLEDVEKSGRKNIISWTDDGNSFRVHDPDSFVSNILGKYFQFPVLSGSCATADNSWIQFRCYLKDWGFDNDTAMVDTGNSGEGFFHPCFQRGKPSLCRYMRCGRKNKEDDGGEEEANSGSKSIIKNVQGRQHILHGGGSIPTASDTNANITTTNNNSNAMAYRNAAAQQLLLEQQLQQAKQQQQMAAIQLQQALLNGGGSNPALLNSGGSNPSVAAFLLNQIYAGKQQQRQPQLSPDVVAAAAAALQQQRQPVAMTTVSKSPSTAVSTVVTPHPQSTNGVVVVENNNSIKNVISNHQQNPSSTSTIVAGMVRPSTIASTCNSPKSNEPNIPLQQFNSMTASTTSASAVDLCHKPKVQSPKNVTSIRPSGAAKRAAFLNKRSKATGSTYRNPNKKQKRIPSSGGPSSVVKSQKRTSSTKAPVHLTNNNKVTSATSFTLNEDFKERLLPDLLFPWKLHDMLDDAEKNADLKENVLAWQADGVSFEIHDTDRFAKEIIPQYFEETIKDWDTFLNVLSSWGFVRFASGSQKGAFIHRLLVKGKCSTCKQMRINGKTVSDWMKHHSQFLGRLHALLCHAEKEGKQSVVSWAPDGKKFTIHDPSAFMNSIFPKYFDHLTYSSFEQKLRRWGFMRFPANHQKMDKDAKLQNAIYGHPCFLRSKVPSLVWIKSDTKISRTLRPEHNFLVRLRVMLSDASRHGYEFVISWSPHGKAFMIHDRPYFSNKIMPNYFKSKFTSFRQSLRNHGFAQIGGNGWDEGAYYHKLFIRDEPLLCQGLTQNQMKTAMPEWIPVEDEPTFYPMDNHESLAAAAAMVSLKSS